MPTNYPDDLDTADDLPSDRTDRTPAAASHAGDHNNLADAVRAIEEELGVLPKGPSASVAAAIATVRAGLSAVSDSDALKAADSAVVHNTGAEAVGGVKTFAASPIVPTPALSDATTKAASMAAVAAEVALDRARLDAAESTIPTAGQKAALAGTSGTPGNTNRYVTASDPALAAATAAANRAFTLALTIGA